MLRLLAALMAPTSLLAQALPASISLGGVTLSASGASVRVSSRIGSVDIGAATKAPAPRAPSPASSGTKTAVSATRVLATADRYVGTRYAWGGTSPKSGFDCSGFVQYVFDRHGVDLPRTSRQQAVVGTKLTTSTKTLRRGDLIFFAQNGSRVDHVAIYAGNNRIIHSTSSGGGVRYDDLSTKRGKWFRSRMVGARRVMANGASLIEALDAELRLIQAFDPEDGAPTQ